jgi:hypothetical protein
MATPVGAAADLAASRITRRRPVTGTMVTGLVVVMVLVTMAALALTGDPVIAAAPVVAGIVALALWALPLRIPLLGLLSLAILADFTPPVPVPVSQMWFFPVRWLQLLLLENLNKVSGIGALRISGVEVVLAGLLLLVALRTALGKREDLRAHAAPLTPLLGALALAVAVLLVAEGWGIARNGDVRQSVWQLKYLLWTPVLAALCMYVVRRPAHLLEVAGALTVVACIKVAIGLSVYRWSMQAGLGRPHSVTSHADTMLFVVVIALWTAVLLHRATLLRVLIALPVIGTLLLGIVINNRRTAYVSLAVVLLLVVIYLPRATRRVVLLGGLALAPLFAAYVVAGRGRGGVLFAPAASVWSVTKQEDASSDSRDVENYNLTLTLRNNFLVGAGFGHPYEEGPASYDLTGVFDQYRFVAHNSVLWLLGILGPVGFALVWLPVSMGTYFAARSLRQARQSTERIAATVVICIFAAYQLQAWADMGTQGWTGSTLVALAFATTSLLAQPMRRWRGHGVRLPSAWRTVVPSGVPHVA